MSSRDISTTCSVCQQKNTSRQLAPQAIRSGETRMFCNTCNMITLQRVNSGGAGDASSTPAAIGSGVVSREQDDLLWTRFEKAVIDSGMRMPDIFRCDDPTRRSVAERLGFRPEADRILTMIRDRHPQNLVAAAAPPQQQQSQQAHQSFIQPPPQAISMAASAPSPSSINPYRRPDLGMESPIRGITYVNDAIIARCSVYPELPAEFWCCTCNVLVSSRCHVQGVHKDHPFITLRVAAEGHVRDLTAWSERCRSQLGVTESVIANLNHSSTLVQQSRQSQLDALEKYTNQLIDDLMRWKEQLKNDVNSTVDTQVASVQFATRQATHMRDTYAQQLQTCDPLMSMVPSADSNDRAAEEWALRVLDFSTKLKLLNVEPIPLPKVHVPEVKCLATPASWMELIKQVSVPLGVRLPDILDPGYFNFPHPTSSSRVPFTLQPPPDAKSKGVLIYSGRTLTRAQDVLPSQTLITASQVFYSGTTSWEVHVDRIGAGPGRILAGIIIHGSDGEGVVWDGQRIVGPNEGECRVIHDNYQLRPGTVLRFVLELDAPQHFLNCFFDRDGVARIPLPPTGNGWVPAFSVFGPQDQITVVPTNSTTRLANVNAASTQKKEDPASAKLKEQEQIIAGLQQQLQSLSMRMDAEQFRATVLEANNLRVNTNPPSGSLSNFGASSPMPNGSSAQRPSSQQGAVPYYQQQTPQAQQQQQQPLISQTQYAAAAAAAAASSASRGTTGGRAGGAAEPTPGSATSRPPQASSAVDPTSLAYSPELQSLLRFVDEIR